MKIKVLLKDPDGFSNCVDDVVEDSLDDLDLDIDEKDVLMEKRLEKTWEKLRKFVDCQEYVTIEFDTDEGTARVVPLREKDQDD